MEPQVAQEVILFSILSMDHYRSAVNHPVATQQKWRIQNHGKRTALQGISQMPVPSVMA